MPVFTAILGNRVGGEGAIRAFLRLLPPTASGVLDLLRADPDPARRERYLNALGAREDDALTPFFLKAIQDPIVEVGQVAMHHLGQLPSSFPALMELFRPATSSRSGWRSGCSRRTAPPGPPVPSWNSCAPRGATPCWWTPPRPCRHRPPGQRAGAAGAAP